MNKLLLTCGAATIFFGVWSGCFVPKGSVGTSSGKGTGGHSTSSSSSSATTIAASSTAGNGGQAGNGGFGGFVGFGGAGGNGAGAGGTPAIDVVCNPVTNANCSTGEACEPTVNGGLTGFACSPGMNKAALCASCDLTGQTPPFCEPDSICVAASAEATNLGQCAHYCCSNADCGTSGVCSLTNSSGVPLFTQVSATLGVCVSPFVHPGDAGAGDAGAPFQFTCNVPAISPSMGSCVTLTL
jgi:hypothetical protein